VDADPAPEPPARRGPQLPPGLDDVRLAAWRALLTAHALLVAHIEEDLTRAGERAVPLTWYDVLIELREAPEHRLRQRDLARAVLLTRSGLSRLVDRLEAAGLVRRAPDPADRRGAFVILTEEGRHALRRTWPLYAQAIARHFGVHLSDDGARALTDLLQPLADAARAAARPSSSADARTG